MVFFRQKIDIPLAAWDTLLWDERVDIFDSWCFNFFKCPLADWVQIGSHNLPRPARFEHFLNIWSYFHRVPYVGGWAPRKIIDTIQHSIPKCSSVVVCKVQETWHDKPFLNNHRIPFPPFQWNKFTWLLWRTDCDRQLRDDYKSWLLFFILKMT